MFKEKQKEEKDNTAGFKAQQISQKQHAEEDADEEEEESKEP